MSPQLDHATPDNTGLINLVLIDSGSGSIKVGVAHLDSDHSVTEFYQDKLGLKFAEDLEKQHLINEIMQSGQLQNIYHKNNKPLNLCSIFNVDNRSDIMSIFENKCSKQAYEFLVENYSNKFSEAIKGSYINMLTNIVKETSGASEVRDTEVWLVGTAALRKSDDGQHLLDSLKDSVSNYAGHVDFKIISQHSEGEYAFKGAVMKSGISEQDAIVWDIGGGSMQISFNKTEDNSFSVLGNTVASAYMYETIKESCGKSTEDGSIYPMSQEQLSNAILLASNKVTFLEQEQLEQFFLQKKTSESTRILGVGTIHNGIIDMLKHQHIIQEGVGFFEQADLLKLINSFADKSAEQIKDLLPEGVRNHAFETCVTNTVLVYGAMQKYGIDKVDIINASNLDALLYEAQKSHLA
jgi:exopolyphosphatase/guanosine-5'-triphosphate,3'-diphosphate pyrophosphatase